MCNMQHKSYPLHLMYVCTLPCKVVGVKIVAKHGVIVSKNWWNKMKTFFSDVSRHHLFTLLLWTFEVFTSHFSPLTVTPAVRWWHHCCTAHTWWYGLPSPINKQSGLLYILHRQCQFNEVERMPTSTTNFRQVIVMS